MGKKKKLPVWGLSKTRRASEKPNSGGGREKLVLLWFQLVGVRVGKELITRVWPHILGVRRREGRGLVECIKERDKNGPVDAAW